MSKDFGISDEWGFDGDGMSEEESWSPFSEDTDTRQNPGWGGTSETRGFSFLQIPMRAILICAVVAAVAALLWIFRDTISDFLIMIFQWVVLLAIIVIILKLIFRRRRR